MPPKGKGSHLYGDDDLDYDDDDYDDWDEEEEPEAPTKPQARYHLHSVIAANCR